MTAGTKESAALSKRAGTGLILQFMRQSDVNSNRGDRGDADAILPIYYESSFNTSIMFHG